MPSPEKFRETLTEFAVEDSVIGEINRGYETVVSKSTKKIKSAYFKQALDVLNASLPPERVKEILEANACCKSGSRLKNSRAFAEAQKESTVEERLALIRQRTSWNMGYPELDEDGFLIVHAVAYHPTDRFECACPSVSRVKRDYSIPREYCYCCGGHFKFHYEIMLGVKLELCEIVSSPHDTEGREPCVFKYRLLPADLRTESNRKTE